MDDARPGILIVDDDEAVARLLERMMQQITDDVVVTYSGDDALVACRQRSFDLVISDMRMPGIDGIELMHLMSVDYPSTRRMILTGHADLEQTMRAINQGRVHRYLTKPWATDELLDAVREELGKAERERSEIKRLREAIDILSSSSDDRTGRDDEPGET